MTSQTNKHQQITDLLKLFPQKRTAAVLLHFSESVHAFENGEWEKSIHKAGKFVEATIKALAEHAGLTLPRAREFKVGNLVIQLGQLSANAFDECIRLQIPRNCVFVYDIASNRGSRHDPGEIDVNKMDAIVTMQNISWVLAEMIRFCHKDTLKPDDAADIVDSLMEKRYPDIEEIDGRVYVNRDKLSANEVALIILERKHPARVNRTELLKTLLRHSFTKNGAQVALTRIKKYIDDDGLGNIMLRAHGRQKAASIRAQRAN